MPSSIPAPRPETGLSGAYRAVWRWHFHAGLLVMPFLMLLALTGGLYLFNAEIDRAVYADMARVEARTEQASPDRWAAAARVATNGGEVADVLVPARPNEAVRLTVRMADDSRRTVFVDPHNAQVTGVTAYGGVMETIKRLHSLELFGPVMNIVVEIVAGWAIILVATGVFLWWPRGRDVGVVSIKAANPARRPFWRDLHAVTGVYAGAVVVFLAVTGMPWSSIWGDRVLNVMRESGLGRPAARGASPWLHAEHQDAPRGVGWTMEGAVLPTHDHGAMNLSRVIDRAEASGLPRPYLVSVPKSEGLAFAVARQSPRVEDTRTLYIDGATGQLRADIGYDRFGAGAKAFEWGIAVHQGAQYGQINRLIMLGGCIAIWLLSISGLIMWWRRRPKGRLAAPVAPPGPRVRAAVLGIVIPLCILYPLTGLSLLVAVGLDRAVVAMRKRASAAV